MLGDDALPVVQRHPAEAASDCRARAERAVLSLDKTRHKSQDELDADDEPEHDAQQARRQTDDPHWSMLTMPRCWIARPAHADHVVERV